VTQNEIAFDRVVSDTPRFPEFDIGAANPNRRKPLALTNRQAGSLSVLLSDAHPVAGGIGDYTIESDLVLGHESSGIVLSVGSEVTTLRVPNRRKPLALTNRQAGSLSVLLSDAHPVALT
jgi:hypothetical protein